MEHRYTICALYADNLQRFCHTVTARSAADAFIAATRSCAADNNVSVGLRLGCVFKGEHQTLDIDTLDAQERPAPRHGMLTQEKSAFTVVLVAHHVGTPSILRHVLAHDAVDAERRACGPQALVAGVFAGHITPELNDGRAFYCPLSEARDALEVAIC